MLALLAVAVMAAATYALFRYSGRHQNRSRVVRRALYAGGAVGLCRGIVASAGWYVVEHAGGPIQAPAYALAMLAWPEAAVFAERRTTPSPPEFYPQLSLLLIVTTASISGLIAAVATRRHRTDIP